MRVSKTEPKTGEVCAEKKRSLELARKEEKDVESETKRMTYITRRVVS